LKIAYDALTRCEAACLDSSGKGALEAEYPLAATLMRRSMIEDTLNGAKHKRYRYAAKHLVECAASDAAITDYGNFSSHEQFVATLKADHSRKHGFWGLVSA